MAVALLLCLTLSAKAQFQQSPQQGGQGQVEVTDEELERFIKASREASDLQIAAQQQILNIVEGEGIDPERYKAVMQARERGRTFEDLDVSSDEQEKIERAAGKLEELGSEVYARMVEIAEKQGLEMGRFQELNMAIQQDRELQQRLEQAIERIHQQEDQQH